MGGGTAALRSGSKRGLVASLRRHGYGVLVTLGKPPHVGNECGTSVTVATDTPSSGVTSLRRGAAKATRGGGGKAAGTHAVEDTQSEPPLPPSLARGDRRAGLIQQTGGAVIRGPMQLSGKAVELVRPDGIRVQPSVVAMAFLLRTPTRRTRGRTWFADAKTPRHILLVDG